MEILFSWTMLLFSLKTGTLSVAFPGNIDIFSTPCSIHNVVLDVLKCSVWWSQMKVCYIYQCVPHLPIWCSIKLFTHFFFFWTEHLDYYYLAMMSILKGTVSSTHSFFDSIIFLHSADSAVLESIHFTSVLWLLPG